MNDNVRDNLVKLGAWEMLQKKLTWEQLGELEGKTGICQHCFFPSYYIREAVEARERE